MKRLVLFVVSFATIWFLASLFESSMASRTAMALPSAFLLSGIISRFMMRRNFDPKSDHLEDPLSRVEVLLDDRLRLLRENQYLKAELRARGVNFDSQEVLAKARLDAVQADLQGVNFPS